MAVSVSGFQNLFLQSAYSLEASFPLYISSGPQPTGSIPLFLKTQISCAWENIGENWEEIMVPWESGCPDAQGVSATGIGLFTSGHVSPQFTDTLTLYIPVYETTGNSSGTLPLYLSAGGSPTGTIPLYLKTDDPPTAELSLFIKGGSSGYPAASGFSSGSINLYISGSLSAHTTGSIPLFINTVSSATISSEIPLYLNAQINGIAANVPLFLYNVTTTGTVPLFIKGYWLSKNEIPSIRDKGSPFNPFWRSGAKPATGTIPFYIPLEDDIDGNINLFISGSIQTTGTLNLYTSGANISSGSVSLMMGPASGFSTGSMPLYIHGTFAEPGGGGGL